MTFQFFFHDCTNPEDRVNKRKHILNPRLKVMNEKESHAMLKAICSHKRMRPTLTHKPVQPNGENEAEKCHVLQALQTPAVTDVCGQQCRVKHKIPENYNHFFHGRPGLGFDLVLEIL